MYESKVPFGNNTLELIINNGIKKTDSKKRFKKKDRKKIAKEVRKEMSNEEYADLTDKNIPEDKKRDILKDINERLKEKGAFPPELQEKLDEFEKDNTPPCEKK